MQLLRSPLMLYFETLNTKDQLLLVVQYSQQENWHNLICVISPSMIGFSYLELDEQCNASLLPMRESITALSMN